MKAKFVIAAVYRFVSLPNFEEIQKPLLDFLLANNIRGTLLLAKEGINGTVAASQTAIDGLLAFLSQYSALAGLDCKFSYDDEMPFYRSRVKLKNEIVTMGVQDIDPVKSSGTYIKAEDWDDFIADPEVTLIDTRNDYETAIGSFKNAIVPNTTSFRDFPEYVKKNLDPKKHSKVAMFCTGGIRCEKSTAYLKQQGFDEVYHLQGGILKYLEKVAEKDSSWKGECFVFDNRVSVNHDLEKGSYDQCHACRLPITDDDKQDKRYLKGVSCPRCFDDKSDHQRLRFKEREKQVELAKQRGESHIGKDANTQASLKKQQKLAFKQVQRELAKNAAGK